jgi:hypothetical protein
MIIAYEYSTPWGVFRILLSGGRWTLFCEEEKLSDYPTAFDALNALLLGCTLRNGHDTSRMDLPAQLRDWAAIDN